MSLPDAVSNAAAFYRALFDALPDRPKSNGTEIGNWEIGVEFLERVGGLDANEICTRFHDGVDRVTLGVESARKNLADRQASH